MIETRLFCKSGNAGHSEDFEAWTRPLQLWCPIG